MEIVQETVRTLFDTFSAYPYVTLFVGMLLMGEMVLLPAIYLAATGRLDLIAVVTLSVPATMFSDCLWYALGRRFPTATLKRMSGRVSNSFLTGLERAFTRNGKKVLFLSKFVYGTRTLVQVLAGIHDMPFRNYILVNTLGVLTVTMFLVAIGYSVIGTTHRLNDVVQHIEIAFLLFLLIAVAGYLLAGRRLKQQWSL